MHEGKKINLVVEKDYIDPDTIDDKNDIEETHSKVYSYLDLYSEDIFYVVGTFVNKSNKSFKKSGYIRNQFG